MDAPVAPPTDGRGTHRSRRRSSERGVAPARRGNCNSMSATPSSAAGWRRRWPSCSTTRSASSEPPEAELRALYEARPDLVRTPARVSFTQVFFDRAEGERRAVRRPRGSVRAARMPRWRHGDRFLLGDTFADQDEQALAEHVRRAFAQAVFRRSRAAGRADRLGLRAAPGEGDGRAAVPDRRPSPRCASALRRNGTGNGRRAAKAQLYAGLMRKYQIVADPAVRPLARVPSRAMRRCGR